MVVVEGGYLEGMGRSVVPTPMLPVGHESGSRLAQRGAQDRPCRD